jgi:two-component system CheB/CheR fusion protein
MSLNQKRRKVGRDAPETRPIAHPGDEPSRGAQEFSIVGIGASAGGLEACSALLKQLPPDTGLAFVVVQHLDPAHESLLPTLLARVTKIPVRHVKNEVTVEPNHVYIMPPNSELLFSDGKLHLIPRDASATMARRPIDRFFRSLAENCQHHAIGVILSGTGSDGAMGLDMIKTAGGFTFAQDSQSARFEGMPNSAFATGSVDFVLPPDGIARELIRISKYPYVKRIDGTAKETQPPPSGDTLGGILALLQKASGVDFSRYRTTTIQRRILRRMAIHHIAETEAYRVFLEKTPGEVRVLCEEMIPRITRFFRDPNVFVALKSEVFAKIIADRPTRDAPIRIWVPGCASGEEVYAIAISLLEFCEEQKAVFQIQIFGTDLSAIAIQTARQGLYPFEIAEDVSPERLQRFFLKQDSGYQITTSVREKCIFANHDLIGDPPYSKLDLISCRNVLIYLDSVQTRVLPMFHYALRPSGFLMLGAMESARRFADLFAPVDKASQIYSKKTVSHRELHNWGLTKAKVPGKAHDQTDVWNDAEVQKRADRAVLARYAPGGVVVNENWQVLQVRGKVTPCLEAAPGKMSVSVLAMAKRSGLSQDLAAALNQAKKDNVPVRREKLIILNEQLTVNLQVFPLREEGAAPAYLIVFEEVPASAPAPVHGADGESVVAKDDFVRMQEELIATRERLFVWRGSVQSFV